MKTLKDFLKTGVNKLQHGAENMRNNVFNNSEYQKKVDTKVRLFTGEYSDYLFDIEDVLNDLRKNVQKLRRSGAVKELDNNTTGGPQLQLSKDLFGAMASMDQILSTYKVK